MGYFRDILPKSIEMDNVSLHTRATFQARLRHMSNGSRLYQDSMPSIMMDWAYYDMHVKCDCQMLPRCIFLIHKTLPSASALYGVPVSPDFYFSQEAFQQHSEAILNYDM